MKWLGQDRKRGVSIVEVSALELDRMLALFTDDPDTRAGDDIMDWFFQKLARGELVTKPQGGGS